MSETGSGDVLGQPGEPPDAASQWIDALRKDGVDHFDPVRLRYLEVLARRALGQQGNVRRVLDAKLQAAVVALRARFEHAQVQAQAAATGSAPETVAPQETLSDLVRHLEQHVPGKKETRADAHVVARTELKSVHYFRDTWSRLSAEKQVNQALGQAPKNAGPINSHVVALRSLALMRDISPDYLNHFMVYMDALLSLDQGDKPPPPPSKGTRAAKSAK